MKTSLRLATAATFSLAAAISQAGERVGDFALIDHQGMQQHMAWYDDHSAIVLLPQAVGQTDATALQALLELRNDYNDQGVQFFLINPGQQTDRLAVATAVDAHDIAVLMDDAQVVSEALGLTHMDQAVVYDPARFEVVYRGPVGAELETAVNALIAGNRSDLVTVASQGAAIDYSGFNGAELTYSADIAPIIAENCAECHREGGIAPFAMNNKQAVQGWSPMIREVVMTKRMPPGQIDNKVGHRMANEM
ncbi:MAG: hypothetical protein MRY76_00530, partial [Pseudomonadales bacterium]|nr:hypothetical protein [Pseudomonadales bacterium]